ncbi:MAG: hypothetical protein CM15mP103_11200 [Gammaproteobacteria bacterium]|nr:MAG: hypothetical protein CM15mP103_11200 [Gammaproteobacteria bacterium]
MGGVAIPDTGNDDRSRVLVTKTLLFSGEGAGMYGARWGGSCSERITSAPGRFSGEVDLGQRQTGSAHDLCDRRSRHVVGKAERLVKQDSWSP